MQDVLALAGDVVSQADTRNLNLARKLNDDEQLDIPLVGEVPPTLPAATLTKLDMLPGISALMGQRIIDVRMQNGNFTKIDDLNKVRGIGDTLFEQVKNLITVQSFATLRRFVCNLRKDGWKICRGTRSHGKITQSQKYLLRPIASD